jgi:hypothetical protein
MLGARELRVSYCTLIPGRKSRWAGGAELDLGSGQTFTVDQNIPRTADRDRAAASYKKGENNHASWSRIIPELKRIAVRLDKHRTWKGGNEGAKGTITIVR